jgi:hypothetical protein
MTLGNMRELEAVLQSEIKRLSPNSSFHDLVAGRGVGHPINAAECKSPARIMVLSRCRRE